MIVGDTDIDIDVNGFVQDVGLPVAAAMVTVTGTVIVAALSYALSRWGDATARRRDGYAAATKVLYAFAEYAWRIRRRTSDTPEALDRLTAIGHELQEALRYHQTWTSAENRWVGSIYREVRADIAAAVGPACNDAWNTGPVTTAAGMCLGSWGPVGLDDHIDRFQAAVAFRFGWRRLLGLIHLHVGVPARTPVAEPANAGAGLQAAPL